MGDYACLQIICDRQADAAQERMLYAVTAYMDAQGLRSCGKESAERTVCFAPIPAGWAVFDDCADRLDLCALNGLGCALTGKLQARGVGVMGAGTGLLLNLYEKGRLLDSYVSDRRAFGEKTCMPRWPASRGRPVQWSSLLAPGHTAQELAGLFVRGEREGRALLPEFRQALGLDETAGFGFSSLEDAKLPGLITLYFCPTNTVRQPLWDRLFHPVRRTATTGGALLRRSRCARERKP